MHSEIRQQQSASVQLDTLATAQVLELINRLESSTYVSRSLNSTRRNDGEVLLSDPYGPESTLQIRMNAFSEQRSAVVTIQYSSGYWEVSRLMVRESRMSGDDRSLFAIPQAVQKVDMQLAENLLHAACLCVARGSVERQLSPGSATGVYTVYLPSIKPLPEFDRDFNIKHLPSLY